MDITKQIGKTVKGNVEDAGFNCPVCDMVFKDSNAYVSHLNSPAHLARKGFGMRVMKSDVSDVKSTLKAKLLARAEKPVVQKSFKELSYQEKLDLEERAKLKRIAEKKLEKELKKKAKRDQEAEEAGLEEDEMALMGFASFGSKKK